MCIEPGVFDNVLFLESVAFRSDEIDPVDFVDRKLAGHVLGGFGSSVGCDEGHEYEHAYEYAYAYEYGREHAHFTRIEKQQQQQQHQ